MVKGLTKAFSCRIFAGRKQTLNTATMDFKRIAHNAVRRWNEKRTARKTMGTTHVATPQAETLPKAANLESTLGGFLAERYEFRFNVLTEATEFRCLSDGENGTFRPATERDLNAICLEAHRHGIDLQYVVKGTERFGITSAEYAEPITEYKPDVTFYKAKKIKYVDSTPDTFFMFFPKNFHQALVKAGKEPEEIRVIVAKIEYIP